MSQDRAPYETGRTEVVVPGGMRGSRAFNMVVGMMDAIRAGLTVLVRGPGYVVMSADLYEKTCSRRPWLEAVVLAEQLCLAWRDWDVAADDGHDFGQTVGALIGEYATKRLLPPEQSIAYRLLALRTALVRLEHAAGGEIMKGVDDNHKSMRECVDAARRFAREVMAEEDKCTP